MSDKLRLPNVTLAAMTSVSVYETVKALQYSMRGIEFGEVTLITHKKPWYLPKEITYRHTDKLTNIDDFNYKIAYDLCDYIDTEYVLLVHHDGFVIHPEKWRQEFLDYDYIGSPWPIPSDGKMHCFHDVYGNWVRVGNSVGIRSKQLLEFPRKANLEWTRDEEGLYNEDIFLCCRHKHDIEAAGMKIAPLEVAKYFGHEMTIPEFEDVDVPFLFHKWYGRNADYPRFVNPVHMPWLMVKKVLRPFVHKYRRWKQEKNGQTEGKK